MPREVVIQPSLSSAEVPDWGQQWHLPQRGQSHGGLPWPLPSSYLNTGLTLSNLLLSSPFSWPEPPLEALQATKATMCFSCFKPTCQLGHLLLPRQEGSSVPGPCGCWAEDTTHLQGSLGRPSALPVQMGIDFQPRVHSDSLFLCWATSMASLGCEFLKLGGQASLLSLIGL